MYDWPEFRDAAEAFWQVLRDALARRDFPVPEALTREGALTETWQAPDLLLGQTCGLPFVLGLCGEARLIATPRYDAEGCGEFTYRSALLARRSGPSDIAEARGGRVAVNDAHSQSGMNTLADAVGRATGGETLDGFFGDIMISGAHRRSADMVAEGEADFCAMDAVAWQLYQLAEPERAAALRVIGWSAEAPALPFITAPRFADRQAEIVAALSEAIGAAPPGPALPVAVRPARATEYQSVRDMWDRYGSRSHIPAD